MAIVTGFNILIVRDGHTHTVTRGSVGLGMNSNKRGASIDLRHAAGKIPEEQLMCILFNFFAGRA